MKKTIFVLLLILSLFATTANAQKYLWFDIYSGMTQEQFDTYCSDKFKPDGNAYSTYINGDPYRFTCLLNENKLVYGVVLVNANVYNSSDYKEDLKEETASIYDELKTIFGKPSYKDWPSESKNQTDAITPVYIFTKNTVQICIGIYKKEEGAYFIVICVVDTDSITESPKTPSSSPSGGTGIVNL